MQSNQPVPEKVDSRYWYGKWGSVQTASTSFNVSVPSFTFSASQTSPFPGKDILALGSQKAGVTGGTAGIYFTGSGGTDSGTLSFAQMLTTQNATIYYQNQTSQPLPPQANQPSLDAGYPYPVPPFAPSGTTNDSPNSGQQDKTTIDIHYTKFAATMYLMWTSNRSNAKAIPVMSVSWSWYGEANYDPATGNGKLFLANSSSSINKISGTSVNTGVLNWGTTWNQGSK